MNRILKGLAAAALCLGATAALASPVNMITHNFTPSESNAYVDGINPSPVPTLAWTTNTVNWAVVRMACYGHTSGGICHALIKMDTDTENPVDVGMVSVNIETGDINPKYLSGNGYTLVVNGPGEVTIVKN